jgi:predicted transcriptional regulator of viral defense system
MNAQKGYAALLRLGLPFARTQEIAAVWGVSVGAAQKMLSRLEGEGLVRHVRHGLWWTGQRSVDPYLLPEYLTAPYPSYVSLLSALHLHGAIEQIPQAVYAVTLARTQRVATPAGTVSLHHLAPSLFDGFDVAASGIKLASVEKAMFDVAYLSQSRIRLFSDLPELSLPRAFDRRAVTAWVQKVNPHARRVRVHHKLRAWGAA